LVVVVLPPPQLNVAPPVEEEAVKVWLRVVQVNTPGGAIAALGGVLV
jgi:hypothetical protein